MLYTSLPTYSLQLTHFNHSQIHSLAYAGIQQTRKVEIFPTDKEMLTYLRVLKVIKLSQVAIDT